MNKNSFILIAIIIITALAGFFVYPVRSKTPLASADASSHRASNGVYPNAIYRYFDISKLLPWRLGLDIIGGTHLVYEIDSSKIAPGDRSSLISGLRDVMERRVNAFGVSEPNVLASKTAEKNYLIIELAGIKNPAEAIEQIGRTAFLEFREVSSKSGQEGAGEKDQPEFTPTELTGRYLSSARLTRDNIGQPQVVLKFSTDGARIFADLTEKNIGKPIAILIDNQVISAPIVRERISGGDAVITGVQLREAENVVNLLNAGALPAPINLASQSTVGASLGAEFLKRALIAGATGTLLIILFLIFYYRSLGVIASLSLIIYIIATLAVFKGISITMSLAGIAGFILSIGMAVDANILIFERAKEEIKNGLSKIAAIEEGFKRAWPSIRDSNISTILTAIILYFFTTSFVQGFALTLLTGVLVSMFTAITVTRVMLRTFIKT